MHCQVLCYATDRDGRGLATAAYLNITVCPYINHPPYMQPTVSQRLCYHWLVSQAAILLSLQLQNMTVCEMQAPGFVGKILAYDIDTVYPFSVIHYYFVDWGMLLWLCCILAMTFPIPYSVSYFNGMPSSAFINQTYPFFIDVNDGSVYTTAQLVSPFTNKYDLYIYSIYLVLCT